MITRRKGGVFKPKLPYVGLFEVKKDDSKPQTIVKALQRPKWKQAMEIEFLKLSNATTPRYLFLIMIKRT